MAQTQTDQPSLVFTGVSVFKCMNLVNIECKRWVTLRICSVVLILIVFILGNG